MMALIRVTNVILGNNFGATVTICVTPPHHPTLRQICDAYLDVTKVNRTDQTKAVRSMRHLRFLVDLRVLGEPHNRQIQRKGQSEILPVPPPLLHHHDFGIRFQRFCISRSIYVRYSIAY